MYVPVQMWLLPEPSRASDPGPVGPPRVRPRLHPSEARLQQKHTKDGPTAADQTLMWSSAVRCVGGLIRGPKRV